MDVGLFDFDLPEDRIALRPASPRDAARLLVVRPDAPEPLQDRGIRDLVSLLEPGDALVLNDTRVIPSRLRGRRYRGADSARVEIMLHKRESEDPGGERVRHGSDYAASGPERQGRRKQPGHSRRPFVHAPDVTVRS